MSFPFYKTFSAVFVCLLFLAGCQKDVQEPAGSINGEIESSDSRLHSNIRFTESNSEFGIIRFDYGKKGLLDTWELVDAASYAHDYDKWGRLKKSKAYDADGSLVNTIYFFYNKKGQMDHEKWYEGDTWNLTDEVFHQFDYKGRAKYFESKIQDYKVKLKWSGDDNLLSWDMYIGGIIAARGDYSYNTHYKNPFHAVPGLPVAYNFSNGYFFQSKRYATTEDYYEFDENGTLIGTYTQDPSKTIARPGPAGYPSSQDVYDNAEQSFIHFVFSYEKGKRSRHVKDCGKDAKAWRKFLHRGGKKTMKEKAKELRSELGNRQ